MTIILDDFHSKVIGGGVIGTITREAYNIAFRHFYKLIEVYEL